MFHDQVRCRRAQLRDVVVARQYRARMHTAVPGCLNIVLHVANKQRLIRHELLLLEDSMDFLALVPHTHERLIDEWPERRRFGLHGPMVRVNAAQHERAHASLPTELQELPRMRQRSYGILAPLELGMEP